MKLKRTLIHVENEHRECTEFSQLNVRNPNLSLIDVEKVKEIYVRLLERF